MAGSGVFPKTATLDIVYQGDYNLIQSTIAGVLSTYYGQTMSSGQLSSQPVIAALQWDVLRQDINKCYKHITNANSTILDVAPLDIVLAGDANAYKVAADYCAANQATVAAAQLTTNVESDSITAEWNGTRTFRVTYTWTSESEANAWFNLGGYFVVDLSGANASTSKGIDWRDNILNVIATQVYTRSNWTTGTDINVYEYGNNAKYSENYARIYCQKLSSTQLDIYVIISDVDSGDQTGTGPAVDENVETDVSASITRYSSYDAIVAPTLSVNPVSSFNSTVPVTVNLLLVGGGGAGGSGWPDGIGGGGSGGGGGGLTAGTVVLQAGLAYPVTVATGGTNIPYPTPGQGGSGGNSSISSLVGYGGQGGFPQGGGYSAIGGIGGIGSPDGGVTYYTGGAGGAYNSAGGVSTFGGGGGGGGSDDIPDGSGPGGSGATWSINGVVYGGGGGGGADYFGLQPGGAGGGGRGGSASGGSTAGLNGFGGGGGGGESWNGSGNRWGPGGNGGSGVVIVSYVSGSQLFNGGTVVFNGSRWFHTFTSSGTLS